MNKLYNQDFGSYMPGLFKMDIGMNLFENISWNDFSDREKATFIHEYVHYLQDISTTYGISHFNFLSQILNMYFFEINKSNTNEVIVPIRVDMLKSEYSSEAYEQIELISLYEGSSENVRFHHINKIIREPDDIFNDEFRGKNGDCLYNINIYYNDSNIPYIFGRFCVAESMAYLIEIKCYPIDIRNNEFPYNTAQLICENLYSVFSDVTWIIALCDISLMHYHCGDFLYNALKYMKEDGFIPNSVQDVYNYLLPKIDFITEIFSKEFIEVHKNADMLYTHKINQTNNVNIWIKDKFTKGFCYRIQSSNFITNIALQANESDISQYIMKLIGIFKLPIINDQNNNVYNEQNDLGLLLVPIALLELFTKSSSKKCYMYDFCKKQKINKISNYCLESPWKQVEDNELCPLAMYWYHYSLEGKSIKYRDV